MINFIKNDFAIDKIELACYVEDKPGTAVHKNRASHGLALFLGGSLIYYFDNKKLKVDKNTIVYFPKGSDYSIKIEHPCICYAINFQMSDGKIFEPFAFKTKNPALYSESFKNSQKIWSQKNPGYTSKIKSELYNVIYRMQSEYDLPYGCSKTIRPAIDYIHSNYCTENISVEYLAEICNISVVHLRNTFIKVFAMPPIKYINNLKMMRAKELLVSRLYTVSEVCFLSGFNNESYFSREFKKHFGVSPSEYLKATL